MDETGGEESEESFSDKASELFDGVSETVKKVGVGKILLSLVLLFVAYTLFSYYSSLSVFEVRVSEKDSSKSFSAETVLISYPGLFSEESKYGFDEAEGLYKFSGVPSNRQVQVTVEQSGYESLVEAVVPGEIGGAFSAQLAKNTPVRLDAVDSLAGVSMGASCNRFFTVVAKNEADYDAEGVSLAGDDLPGFYFVGDPATISSNGSVSLQFSLSTKNAEKGETSGRVRVKGTSRGLDVSLVIGENPRMDVSPEDIRQSSERLEPVQVIIRNTGETDLSNIKISPPGDLVSIPPFSAEDNASLRSRKPDAEFKFWVTPTAKGQGFITVSADCIPTKQIGLYIE